MSNPNTLARPYVQALFNVASAEGASEAWADAIDALALLAKHGEAFLSDPRIPSCEKVKFLTEQVSLEPAMVRWLEALAHHQRLTLLPFIQKAYVQKWMAARGEQSATVETAYPLDEATTQHIQAYLEKRYAKRIRMQTIENRQLIGGVRMHVGDEIIDASIQNQLKRLHQQMTKA